MSVNEIFAIRGMRLARKMGKQIPQDISFIGFTDGLLSRYSIPTLSCMAQHGEGMGEEAARLLIDKIENEYDETDPDSYTTQVIRASLIERESTI